MRKPLLVLFGLLLCLVVAATAADLSGTWNADVVLDAGSGTATFEFKQSGDTLTGTYSGALGEAKVTGTVNGDEVTWTFEHDEAGKIVYKGKLEGGKIKGTVEYGQLGKGTFTATKK